MKKAALSLLVLFTLKSSAQTREDSLKLITQFGKWIDLNFTTAEADSLLGALGEYREAYKSMHAAPITNQVRFPFAFDPAPVGYKTNTKQQRFEFPLTETKLPKDLQEISFYPIGKLA